MIIFGYLLLFEICQG